VVFAVVRRRGGRRQRGGQRTGHHRLRRRWRLLLLVVLVLVVVGRRRRRKLVVMAVTWGQLDRGRGGDARARRTAAEQRLVDARYHRDPMHAAGSTASQHGRRIANRRVRAAVTAADGASLRMLRIHSVHSTRTLHAIRSRRDAVMQYTRV